MSSPAPQFARAETVRAEPSLLDGLALQPADPLLALIGAYRQDPRPDKIDLGVGVFRDEAGGTPIMQAVKLAEERLVRDQLSKGYLGPEGDLGFFELLKPVVFGDAVQARELAGLQTPGGTGALRLAAELIAAARPGARVLVGAPTWPNHRPILSAAQLEVVAYPFFDVASQTLLFERMAEALEAARRGDVVLLHGCCHNPTGADLDPAQWRIVAEIVARRGLVPLVDLAYQGLGSGLDEDAAGARLVLAQAEEGLLAYSCDKNFGLYRERTGALFVRSATEQARAVIQSNLLALARANWSMPPDHGAAVVRTILEDEALTAAWRRELAGMCARIAGLRRMLADADPALAPLARQHGMFSTLPLTPAQVAAARDAHGIYMAGSGRINIAGLTPAAVKPFIRGLAAVTGRSPATLEPIA